MKLFQWESVGGDEIEDVVLRSGSVNDLIEPCEAIYVWRRTIKPPANIVASRSLFIEWVKKIVEARYSVVTNREISHYITLERLVLGGGSLSENKHDTLRDFASDEKSRRLMLKYLVSLNQFLPPLYVGETIDLSVRARQHVKCETRFGELLFPELSLKWSDVELHYYGIGPKRMEDHDTETRKARRTLFEMITTRLSLAGCVNRIG